MEGLMLIIGLIVWFASSAKKNSKKKQNKPGAVRFPDQKLSRSAQSSTMSKPIHDELAMEVSSFVAEGDSVAHSSSAENAFRGSLQAESLEGECICDPSLEHEREMNIDKDSVYENEIGGKKLVDISAAGIMQAIVMNEILTRPKQRMRRY